MCTSCMHVDKKSTIRTEELYLLAEFDCSKTILFKNYHTRTLDNNAPDIDTYSYHDCCCYGLLYYRTYVVVLIVKISYQIVFVCALLQPACMVYDMADPRAFKQEEGKPAFRVEWCWQSVVHKYMHCMCMVMHIYVKLQ